MGLWGHVFFGASTFPKAQLAAPAGDQSIFNAH